MKAPALLPAACILAAPALLHAQEMDHGAHDMGGMGHAPAAPSAIPPDAPSATDPHAGHIMPQPAPAPDAPMDHDGMGHGAMAHGDMNGATGDHGGMVHGAGGTALPAGDAPPPPAPTGWAADAIHDPAAMARIRSSLQREHGGGRFSQIVFNLAEYQVREGRDGFRWDGEGWFGGDINRLTVKTEGSATRGEGVGDAEIQALYSRAIGPYFNLQAGVRHDIRPRPSRTYAAIGVEGLSPYWFDVEAALFLSTRGDLLGRVEATYDQRITQRLILQPRIELNLAAQDVPATGVGSGLSDAELGLRLRYEIVREFAPYIGISHDRRFGDTARFARLAGEDRSSTSFVAGIRFWF